MCIGTGTVAYACESVRLRNWGGEIENFSSEGFDLFVHYQMLHYVGVLPLWSYDEE